MAINVVCPSCRKAIQAPDNAAGKSGKCPFCQQPVQIPNVSVAVPTQQAVPTQRAVPAQRAVPVQQPAPAQPTRVEVGAAPAPSGGAGVSTGGLPRRLFAGTTYFGTFYYVAGMGSAKDKIVQAVSQALAARGPDSMKVRLAQAKSGLRGQVRDVIEVRWSIGRAYVVCFAPGTDLFISARVNFVPGCLAKILLMTKRLMFWWMGFGPLEPNLFGLDDLNVLGQCAVTTVEEQLDAFQLDYSKRGTD